MFPLADFSKILKPCFQFGGIYLGVQLLADPRGFRGFTPVTVVNSTSGWPASFELMMSCSVHSLTAMKRGRHLSLGLGC